jgi:hypothetical protein
LLLITIVSGPDKGQVLRLPDGQSHTVGRHHGSVSLDDNRVSRRHVKFRPHGLGWTLTDLGSSNGTWVNQKQVETTATVTIRDGDRIQVGKTLFTANIVPELPAAAEHRKPLAERFDDPGDDAQGDLLDEPVGVLTASDESESGRVLEHDSDSSHVASVQNHALLSEIREAVSRLHQSVAERPAPVSPVLVPSTDPALRHQLAEILQRLESLAVPQAPSPPPQLAAIEQGLQRILDKLAAAPAPAPLAAPVTIDTAPLQRKIEQTLEAVAALAAVPPLALPAPVAAVDTAPLQRTADQTLEAVRRLAAVPPLAIPAPTVIDTAPLQAKIDQTLEAIRALAAVPRVVAPVPTVFDTAPLQAKIDQALEAIRKLPTAAAAPSAPQVIDTAPLQSKIDQTFEAVRALAAVPPVIPPAPTVIDTAPLQSKIDQTLEAIRALAAVPPVAMPAPIDTAPLHAKIDQALEMVRALAAVPPVSIPAPTVIDTAPLSAKLDQTFEAVRALAAVPPVVVPAPVVIDVEPLRQRIDQTLEAVNKLAAAPAAPAPDPAVSQKLEQLLAAVAELKQVAPADAQQAHDYSALLADLRSSVEGLASAPAPAAVIDPNVNHQLDAIVAILSHPPDDSLSRKLDDLVASLEALRLRPEPKPQVVEHPQFQAAAAQLIALLGAKPDTELEIVRRLDEILDVQSRVSAIAPASPSADPLLIDQLAALRAELEALPQRLDGPITDKLESLAADLRAAVRQAPGAEVAAAAAAQVAEMHRSLFTLPQRLDEQIAMRLEEMRATLASASDRAADKLAAQVQAAAQGLESSVAASAAHPAAPAPDPEALRNITRELTRLKAAVEALPDVLAPAAPAPVVAAPAAVIDIAPLQQKLDQLLAAVSADRTAALGSKLDAVAQSVRAAAAAPAPVVDTAPLQEKLEQVLAAIAKLAAAPAPVAPAAPAPVDTAPLHHKLDAILDVMTVPIPVAPVQPAPPSTEPLLQQIREQLAVLAARPEPAAAPARDTDAEIALLGRLTDQVHQLPHRLGHEKLLSDIFNLLRSMELQQERQAEKLRRLSEQLDSAPHAASAPPRHADHAIALGPPSTTPLKDLGDDPRVTLGSGVQRPRTSAAFYTTVAVIVGVAAMGAIAYSMSLIHVTEGLNAPPAAAVGDPASASAARVP